MDIRHLDEAVRLSAEAVSGQSGGPFGAVVVRGSEIIGRGFNRVIGDRDPTAHAEIVAIRHACATIGSFSLADCELYASTEPCPMCLGAAYWARIKRIYYANTRLDAERIGFDDNAIYEEFSRPPESRRIPTIHVPHSKASNVMKAWSENPGKVLY